MRHLVTGVAGFIGSHLAERLLSLGDTVIGVDSFTDFYPRHLKEENIKGLVKSDRFTLVEGDLLEIDLDSLTREIDYIFHQAAQAGVRESWGKNFQIYTTSNLLSTQRLLEAVKSNNLKGFIFASSSSVYGDTKTLPLKEEDLPIPISPYGVTKLAAEGLCHLYYKNFGVPVISLRYFTVYGPRQRPDMAFHRFISASLSDEEALIYGDGKQTRDFTYISDVVEANILAMESGRVGEIFNIGGGTQISLNEAIEILEGIIGKGIKRRYVERQRGDVRDTRADITRARERLGYRPKVELREGLEEEVRWLKGG
jgi:UDP-glucose 4-epimerase